MWVPKQNKLLSAKTGNVEKIGDILIIYEKYCDIFVIVISFHEKPQTDNELQ